MMIAIDHWLLLVQTPERWPLYPYLCLTDRHEKDGQFPRLGVLVYGPALGLVGYETTVILVNVGDIRSREQLATLPKIRYESAQELLESWRVD